MVVLYFVEAKVKERREE